MGVKNIIGEVSVDGDMNISRNVRVFNELDVGENDEVIISTEGIIINGSRVVTEDTIPEIPSGGVTSWNDLEDKPTKVSAFENDKGYLTAVPAQYVTDTKLNKALSEIQGGECGAAITDVLELPTEDINTSCFYRLTTGTFVYEGTKEGQHTIYCVDELPEVGEPVTIVDTNKIIAYFNVNSKTIHGYIDAMLSAGLGIPSGWYGEELFAAFEVAYGGVITDIADSEGKEALFVLLERRMYFYDNGWCEAAFGYEKAPEFDIRWDGEIGDRFALDMSLLGFANTYFVKVSDRVFTTEELIGAIYTQSNGYEHEIAEGSFDVMSYPGAFIVDGGVVIAHTADELNAALGVPAGYITNGTYFVRVSYDDGEVDYTDRLVAPSKIMKIDGKFIDFNWDLHNVAFTGNYYDLLNRPVVYEDVVRYAFNQGLSSTQKSYARNNIDVYSKSEVDQKIANSGISVDLSGYAKTSDLAAYAKTSDLDVYAKTSDLAAYAKTSDLDVYAKTSDVQALETQIGDISAALDELHAYAQSKVSGGDA